MLVKTVRQEDIAPVESVLSAAFAQPPVVADVRRTGPGRIIEITVFYPDRTISLEDCAAIARTLMEAPETAAVFGPETALSVASPGLGRRLTTGREMKAFAGQTVLAAWRDAESRAEKEEDCVLEAADSGNITLRTKTNGLKIIAWNEMRSIRLSETESRTPRGEP